MEVDLQMLKRTPRVAAHAESKLLTHYVHPGLGGVN